MPGFPPATPAQPLAVTAYQDDFDKTGKLHVNVNDDKFVYDLLQEDAAHTKNKFAEAYIQPALTTLNNFDTANVPGQTYAEPEHLEGKRGTAAAGSETDLFWVAYLSTAFEWRQRHDGDPPDELDTPLGFTSISREISLVFKETSRDIGRRITDLQLPLVTAHEIGHQLGLAADVEAAAKFHRDQPINLMSGVTLEASKDDAAFKYEYIRLHPIDIANIRKRVNSPGTP